MPDPTRVAPGALVKPRRFVPRFHWELLACGVAGHQLLGTDAKTLRPEDQVFARDTEDTRWHRCLRCDAWVPLDFPTDPSREFPPDRDEVKLPLRGRPLRDKVVLRLIAVNRFLHFLGLGLIGAAILLFSANRDDLHDRVINAVAALTGTATGKAATTGLNHDVERLFSLNSDKLHLFAAVALIYAAIEGIEAVGLWWAKRWAEYLTLIVTASLLPLEVYELYEHATPFKGIAFVINLAVVAYLLYAKRLFGIRGGGKAEHALREADLGWDAVEAGTPRTAGLLRDART
ncbi:MAG: DUF2127 domain-containing protein [Solirubrobacteraceae bacterium]|nr:DUF2127 domain-containing protein [Patulibacter sp.]